VDRIGRSAETHPLRNLANGCEVRCRAGGYAKVMAWKATAFRQSVAAFDGNAVVQQISRMWASGDVSVLGPLIQGMCRS
jgi:hypothetical protein